MKYTGSNENQQKRNKLLYYQ